MSSLKRIKRERGEEGRRGGREEGRRGGGEEGRRGGGEEKRVLPFAPSINTEKITSTHFMLHAITLCFFLALVVYIIALFKILFSRKDMLEK